MDATSFAFSPSAATGLGQRARRALMYATEHARSVAGLLKRLDALRADTCRDTEVDSLRDVLNDHHVQVIELHRPGTGYGAGTGLYAGTCYVVEDARSLFMQRRLTLARQRELLDMHGQSCVGLMVVGPAGMPVADGVRHVIAEGEAEAPQELGQVSCHQLRQVSRAC